MTKKVFLITMLIAIFQSYSVKGQLAIKESMNKPYVYVLKVNGSDTLIIDSLLTGLNKFEKFIVQQNIIYKYSNGFSVDFVEYFTLEKYSIESNSIKMMAVSSVFSSDFKKLFETGLKIDFNEKGVCFQIPNQYYGSIILPFDFFINQKRLDAFMSFLKKSITN
jgi:hypothetical protein